MCILLHYQNLLKNLQIILVDLFNVAFICVDVFFLVFKFLLFICFFVDFEALTTIKLQLIVLCLFLYAQGVIRMLIYLLFEECDSLTVFLLTEDVIILLFH